MQKPLFTGACTALVTPFLDGAVNYPMMELLLRRQIDSGIQAVVISGTTGESPTLTDAEKLEMVRRAKKFAGDQCTIIAGTGSSDTRKTVELSVAAQEAGADALLVVSPSYSKPTPAGMAAHYQAIAEKVSVPILLYNVPSRTGVDMPVSLYQHLSGIANIVGVKEASGDIRKITEIRRACPDSFTVWSGNDDLAVPSMALGAKGIVSVLSNVCPLETCAMAEAATMGDYATAEAIHRELYPLIKALFCETNPIPVKYVLHYMGYDCGGLRLPLTELSEENQQKIRKLFQ